MNQRIHTFKIDFVDRSLEELGLPEHSTMSEGELHIDLNRIAMCHKAVLDEDPEGISYTKIIMSWGDSFVVNHPLKEVVQIWREKDI
jgi:hypothetical protein